MKRRVALKVLPPAVANDPGMLERFRREAQAAAVLDHPNIVRAYDFRQENQLYVLVMEYVNGPSLEQVMAAGGPMSVPVACEYIRQAALGLQHAHEQGIVHRDIKPGNLLVDPTGIVKILDMGLARFEPDGQESLTKKFDENTVMGTADYLAPEQAINLHNVDHRADIYSLGATLYALLAGEAPFQGGTVTQKLLWHQMRDPPPLDQRRRDVPADVADVVQTMMAKDAGQRYQTAADAADALAPFCATTPTAQGPARPGAGNGATSSARLRSTGRSGPPSTSRKMKPPPPTAREAVPERARARDDRDDEDRRIRARREEDDRDDRRRRDDYDRDEPRYRRDPDPPPVASGSGVFGVMLLVGVILLVLLIVGGVIAFLVFGPSPTVSTNTSTPPVEERPQVQAPTPVPIPVPIPPSPPQKLPDVVGVIHVQGEAHAKGLERIAFSPDGRRLLTSSQDRTVKHWDAIQKRFLGQLNGHENDVYTVAFGGNGSTALTASADGSARTWQVSNHKPSKRFNMPGKSRVWCAVFGRTDNDVVTGSEDGVVRLWSAKAPSKATREMKGHTAAVNSLAMRGKLNQVVSASWDKTLKLWDVGSGKELRTLTGHTGLVASVATSADGKVAVSGGYDATVRVWDLDSGSNTHTFTSKDGHVWAVALTADGRRALSGGEGKSIQLWDLKHKALERTFEGHTNSVTGLAFTPDGKHFASCSLDQTFRLWGLPPLKP
jgi:serine/threonine protein kinase